MKKELIKIIKKAGKILKKGYYSNKYVNFNCLILYCSIIPTFNYINFYKLIFPYKHLFCTICIV